MKQRWVIIVILVAALVITAGFEFGRAADCFLKMDGIKGESMDSKHKDEIQVLSWSWGETQTGTAAHVGAGAGTGKANFKDIIFTAKTSTASPKLFLTSASGQHIQKVVLTCRNPGGQQREFLKILFEDVMVSSYQTGGTAAAGDVPLDQFSLNYSKVKMDYAPPKPDGTSAPAVSAGWDLKQNKVQ